MIWLISVVGRKEGRKKGREDGRKEGREEGRNVRREGGREVLSYISKIFSAMINITSL